MYFSTWQRLRETVSKDVELRVTQAPAAAQQSADEARGGRNLHSGAERHCIPFK